MHRTQRFAWRTCANVSLRYPPFDYSDLGWFFWCEFWAVSFLRVNFWGGPLYQKTLGQKIRPQHSAPKFGLKHSHPRIRRQIRVHEVQNPLCGNLPLTFIRIAVMSSRSRGRFEMPAIWASRVVTCSLRLLGGSLPVPRLSCFSHTLPQKNLCKINSENF